MAGYKDNTVTRSGGDARQSGIAQQGPLFRVIVWGERSVIGGLQGYVKQEVQGLGALCVFGHYLLYCTY